MKSPRFHLLASFLAILLFFTLAHPATKDEWVQVRSANFNLVGNASEKDVSKVAVKLEQFREAFRKLFAKLNITSSIPTNVVVFKSSSSYKPFKPRRPDGKADTYIAGYFQAGDDVNYITLSTGGEDADTFGTIFHEYVHFIVNTNFGKTDIPAWFNEGLAEFFQTFAMENSIEAKLGLPQFNHVSLLSQNKLVPFDTFFNLSNAELHKNGDHSRNIFYAQAWVIVHYFFTKQKTVEMSNFLVSLLNGKTGEKAFQDVFKMSYAQLEKEIKRYLGQNTFQYTIFTFREKIAADVDLTAVPLSEADVNAYLGDLLYHTRRYDEAEKYLLQALALDPDSSMANTALGMVKMRQEKMDESAKYLEKAISVNSRNHIAYYQLAFLLSREGTGGSGFAAGFRPETAAKIRNLAQKAIEIEPRYAESYELLAFISLVSNEGLDEAAAAMRKALSYQPGNQRYLIRIAEIYLRQKKFDDALTLATKLAQTTEEADVRLRAEWLVENVNSQRQILAQFEASQRKYEADMGEAANNGGGRLLSSLSGGSSSVPGMDEAAAERAVEVIAMNRAIRKPLPDEKRMLGNLTRIECKGGAVYYSVKTPKEVVTFTSKDFRAVTLGAFITTWKEDTQVGCNADLASFLAVISFRPLPETKGKPKGEVTAIEFVPDYFRFIDTTAVEREPPAQSGLAASILDALRKPAEGERRELGFIEELECGANGTFLYLKTGERVLKLSVSPTSPVQLRSITVPNPPNLICGIKRVEVPVVFIYRVTPDGKTKSEGEIVSMDFVPKDFRLENPPLK